MYHSNQQRSLKCHSCGLISKEVSKAYFDENNYCTPCLVDAVKNTILQEKDEFKKPDFS
jgi:hypothetical protein